MQIHNLSPADGSTHKRKRIGRGGCRGGSSGKGMKGQLARSGGGKPPWFEGGQTPFLRRIPKRGFSNVKFNTKYEVLNIRTLDDVFDDGAEVSPKELKEKGLIKGHFPLKILGDGRMSKKMKVIANAFSKSAKEKIISAGGEVVII